MGNMGGWGLSVPCRSYIEHTHTHTQRYTYIYIYTSTPYMSRRYRCPPKRSRVSRFQILTFTHSRAFWVVPCLVPPKTSAKMLLLHVQFTPQNAREWVPVSFLPHVSLESEWLPERPSQTLNFTMPKWSFSKTLLKLEREHHFWGLGPWISLWTPKLTQIAPNWSKSSLTVRFFPGAHIHLTSKSGQSLKEQTVSLLLVPDSVYKFVQMM